MLGEFSQEVAYNNQSIVEISTMDCVKNNNGLCEKSEPIPIIETIIETANIYNNYDENDEISKVERLQVHDQNQKQISFTTCQNYPHLELK